MLNIVGTKRDYASDELMLNMINNNIVVGCSAVSLLGYSSINVNYGINVYTPLKEFNGFVTKLRKFIYLPNYDINVSRLGSLPTKEKVVCDFLMYPKELSADLYMLDALEGYYEEFGNFDKVYELMKELNIPNEKLDEWFPKMWNGSNWYADD